MSTFTAAAPPRRRARRGARAAAGRAARSRRRRRRPSRSAPRRRLPSRPSGRRGGARAAAASTISTPWATIRSPGLPIETGNDFVQPSTSRTQAASSRIRAASVAGMYCVAEDDPHEPGHQHPGDRAPGRARRATLRATYRRSERYVSAIRPSSTSRVCSVSRIRRTGAESASRPGDRRLGGAEVADLGDRRDDAEGERGERVAHRDERRADARLEDEAERARARSRRRPIAPGQPGSGANSRWPAYPDAHEPSDLPDEDADDRPGDAVLDPDRDADEPEAPSRARRRSRAGRSGRRRSSTRRRSPPAPARAG